jgi:two-component system nitrogen regulation sensor histidine kinase NtrY
LSGAATSLPPAGEDTPRRSRLADRLLGRAMTLGLAVTALLLGIATFVQLAGGSPTGPTGPGQVVAIVLANAAVLVLLAASLVARIVRVWAERRRGSAGSRLHVRLVLLFGVVAVVPALIVAAFAAVFFNLGIQAWFNDRVRSTLEVSLVASRAWLDNHRDEIRVDALAMAADLNRAAQVFLPHNPVAFERTLATQASIRGLTEAVVIEPRLGQIIAQAGFVAGGVVELPSAWALEQLRQGEVAVVPGESEARVRALALLDATPEMVLVIGRPSAAHRDGLPGIRPAGPQPRQPADHLRAGLPLRGAAGDAGRGADRAGLRQSAGAADQPADRSGRARAERRSLDPGRGGRGGRRARLPLARLQPDDQPARRSARRADGGLSPAR